MITQVQEQKALDDVRRMAEQAKTESTGTCINGEKVFYYAWERSLVPGHIRSEMGVKEFRISKCCEYHFDEMFATDETDEWDVTTKSAVGPRYGAS